MPGLDVRVWSRPCGQANVDGGDVHFVSSCASGRITRLLLADICGYGAVFKGIASELRDLMVRNVNSTTHTRFIREMHERLRGHSAEGGYATALISTFFAPTRSFTLCNAGHAPPLVYRSASGRWSALKRGYTARSHPGEGPPGVVGRDEYQQFATSLELGDMILFYSNAISESADACGKTVGVEGLLDCIGRIDVTHPENLLPSLAASVCTNKAATTPDADETLVLCLATDRSVGWKNNVLAPLRLLSAVTDNTRLD